MNDGALHNPPSLCYPWHRRALAQLTARLDAGRLPHGLLLTGEAGTGKSGFANLLSTTVLCSDREGPMPCGHCRGCRLNASGVHPDRVRVQPDKPERPVVRIDQIRELTEFLVLSSQYGGRRVAIIDPADRMNANAANSLLKTLEEPAADVLILLVCGRPTSLAATLRSRCQAVALGSPSPAEATTWLESMNRSDAVDLLGFAAGAPLRAINLADEGLGKAAARLEQDLTDLANDNRSVPEVAGEWTDVGARRTAELLQQCVADALRTKAAGRDAARIIDSSGLHVLVSTLDWRVLFEFNDSILALRRALDQPLNEALALERLFGGWRHAASRSRRADDR